MLAQCNRASINECTEQSCLFYYPFNPSCKYLKDKNYMGIPFNYINNYLSISLPDDGNVFGCSSKPKMFLIVKVKD